MKITFETTAEQDEALQRSLDAFNAAQGTSLTIEDYSAQELTAKANEHVRYWRSQDVSETAGKILANLTQLTDRTDLAAADAAVADIVSKKQP